MKKIVLSVLIIFIFSGLTFGATIGELFKIKEPTKKVAIQGEVIGDVMRRGNNAWINIKDETSAIGIWVSKSQAEEISTLGDYKHTGDILQVEGIFHKQCSLHGGDTDIHATSIRIIKKGQKRNVDPRPHQFSLAIIAFLLFTIIYLVRRYIQKRTIQI